MSRLNSFLNSLVNYLKYGHEHESTATFCVKAEYTFNVHMHLKDRSDYIKVLKKLHFISHLEGQNTNESELECVCVSKGNILRRTKIQ